MSVTTRQSASEPAPDEPSVSLLVAAILGQSFHPDPQLAPMSFVDLIACHAKVLTYRSDVFESLCFDQIAMVDDSVYEQARALWDLADVRAHAIAEVRAQCQRAAWQLAEYRHLAVNPQDRDKRQ